jgi:hypothetical protein
MKILKNPAVEIVSSYDPAFFEKRLLSFGYPINKKQQIHRTHIDWQSMGGFCFFYDYIGNEEIVSLLKKSDLCNPERKLILELNSSNPIVQLSSIFLLKIGKIL